MKHQKKAFNYAKERARIALFMEMRLGKTLVTIRWAEFNKLERVIIVAPNSVLDVWEEELQDEGYSSQEISIMRGDEFTRRTKGSLLTTRWYIINYEALNRSREIMELPWDGIIIDESTRIRNSSAEITKLLCLKTDHVDYKAILTGLPCPESEMDYYEQFRFLYGSFMRKRNFWYWRREYCYPLHHGGWVVKPSFIPKIKKEVQELAFIMTRKEAGIGSKKIYEKRYVAMNPEQKKLYEQIEQDFEYEYNNSKKDTKWVPVKLEWMSSVASGFTPEGEIISNAKLMEIVSLLKGDLKRESVVIWFKHNVEIEYVRNELSSRGFTVSIFKGDNKDDKEFKKGNTKILCAQGKVGMMGLDWSIASTAIYYSNWYDGELRAQSEDRIIHPKKKEPLLYIDLLSEGTIDIDVLKILKEKKVTSNYFAMKLANNWFKKGVRK